ncbi:PREDICTED: putative pentatricopeptide repeat-containing protein At1g68930 [Tarenaya hassleriana]|uniref:putative pentatricopeptide repeat-containing protein At1g68930 n=1 Tax=Tarenaya hassleriana TaxID=28532 RepID=UPI00053C7253|nr:PREDICTED: putative pentatricopeptide repeat-containing protein At1g68930 [Tarenaya hassleriana]
MRGKIHHLRHSIASSLNSITRHNEEATYTRLVLDCVRANDAHEAKRLQSHIESTSFEPSGTFLFNRLLHIYAKSGLVSYARDLFDKMPVRDVISWNALLAAYARAGSVDKLKEVFDAMPVRDSVSYNTVVSGFSGNGFYIEALEVFLRMQRDGFEPTVYSYVNGLTACSKLSDLRHGREIHAHILVRNLVGGNAFVLNALTDMYAKCGEVDTARWLFDRMVKRTLVSWNLMISGYLSNGQPEKCIDLFNKMRDSGLEPDEFTLSDVLGAYIDIRDLGKARNIFRMFKAKDKVCWTTMIKGYNQNGMEEEALAMFREMLLEGVKPDSFTISSVVASCANMASLHQGQVLHAKSAATGVDTNLLVSSSLVNMYSKCGVTKDAWNVFLSLSVKNIVSWNSMIGGYAQNGEDLKALSLFEEMLRENLKPDNVTFVSLLSACNHAGLVEKGESYFNSMSGTYGLKPNLDHYACMIGIFGHSGNVKKAIDLINDMPYSPNSLIWSTLLSVCAKKGDIEHGETAAKNLFELEPSNAGPYIVLSNMYAKAGRWEDVASVRSLMKAKNVKKSAAYSWVEIDEKLIKFVSGDRTHPGTESIYKELEKLIERLQEEANFTPNTNFVLHNVVEEEKVESICYHSEKLALAFWLMKKPNSMIPIRITKNIRVCPDCHAFMKCASKVVGRQITLRDSHRFHHFVGGVCSCKDYW